MSILAVYTVNGQTVCHVEEANAGDFLKKSQSILQDLLREALPGSHVNVCIELGMMKAERSFIKEAPPKPEPDKPLLYQGHSEGHFSYYFETYNGVYIFKDGDTNEYFTLHNKGTLGVDARNHHDMDIENVRLEIDVNA